MIIVCSVNVIDILCLGWQICFNRPTGQGAFHVHYAGDTPTYAIVHANTMEILTPWGPKSMLIKMANLACQFYILLTSYIS